MNRSAEARNDDYALVMRQRAAVPKNVDGRTTRANYASTRNINPDRSLFRGTEDMAPFNDQLVQYNVTRPYKPPAQGAWKSIHFA